MTDRPNGIKLQPEPRVEAGKVAWDALTLIWQQEAVHTRLIEVNLRDGLLRDAPLSADLEIWQDPERWTAEARRLIAASDCVIVLCGEQTHQSKGVETEIQIAQELDKRYFLLRATRGGTPTRPRHARATDKIWSSRWPTVKTLLEGGTPPDDAGQ